MTFLVPPTTADLKNLFFCVSRFAFHCRKSHVSEGSGDDFQRMETIYRFWAWKRFRHFHLNDEM